MNKNKHSSWNDVFDDIDDSIKLSTWTKSEGDKKREDIMDLGDDELHQGRRRSDDKEVVKVLDINRI